MRLIGLLITFAIIIFLMWQFYLKPAVGPGGEPQTLPQQLQVIEQAKQVKNLIESQSRAAANY